MSSSQPQQVRASHLLIKHSGSRRKASWKDPEGQVIKNTTRDSAVAQLKTLRDEIITGKARFEDLATRYSDCSSAKRGGDLRFSSLGDVCGTHHDNGLDHSTLFVLARDQRPETRAAHMSGVLMTRLLACEDATPSSSTSRAGRILEMRPLSSSTSRAGRILEMRPRFLTSL